ncbi:MAG: PIN domain-containing protein [Leptospiraceae bacterium]|nr:PIN domain-containing protein [Leptospiraceae bacterium]
MSKRYFFDTSVLVSSLVKSHPFHHRAFPFFEQVFKKEIIGIISSHILAELYSVLTTLPVKPKLSPLEVERILHVNIFPKFEIIHLTSKDYKNSIDRVSKFHFSGGMVYDSLHVEAAAKSDSDELLTFNLKHFEKLSGGLVKIRGI